MTVSILEMGGGGTFLVDNHPVRYISPTDTLPDPPLYQQPDLRYNVVPDAHQVVLIGDNQINILHPERLEHSHPAQGVSTAPHVRDLSPDALRDPPASHPGFAHLHSEPAPDWVAASHPPMIVQSKKYTLGDTVCEPFLVYWKREAQKFSLPEFQFQPNIAALPALAAIIGSYFTNLGQHVHIDNYGLQAAWNAVTHLSTDFPIATTPDIVAAYDASLAPPGQELTSALTAAVSTRTPQLALELQPPSDPPPGEDSAARAPTLIDEPTLRSQKRATDIVWNTLSDPARFAAAAKEAATETASAAMEFILGFLNFSQCSGAEAAPTIVSTKYTPEPVARAIMTNTLGNESAQTVNLRFQQDLRLAIARQFHGGATNVDFTQYSIEVAVRDVPEYNALLLSGNIPGFFIKDKKTGYGYVPVIGPDNKVRMYVPVGGPTGSTAELLPVGDPANPLIEAAAIVHTPSGDRVWMRRLGALVPVEQVKDGNIATSLIVWQKFIQDAAIDQYQQGKAAILVESSYAGADGTLRFLMTVSRSGGKKQTLLQRTDGGFSEITLAPTERLLWDAERNTLRIMVVVGIEQGADGRTIERVAHTGKTFNPNTGKVEIVAPATAAPKPPEPTAQPTDQPTVVPTEPPKPNPEPTPVGCAQCTTLDRLAATAPEAAKLISEGTTTWHVWERSEFNDPSRQSWMMATEGYDNDRFIILRIQAERRENMNGETVIIGTTINNIRLKYKGGEKVILPTTGIRIVKSRGFDRKVDESIGSIDQINVIDVIFSLAGGGKIIALDINLNIK